MRPSIQFVLFERHEFVPTTAAGRTSSSESTSCGGAWPFEWQLPHAKSKIFLPLLTTLLSMYWFGSFGDVALAMNAHISPTAAFAWTYSGHDAVHCASSISPPVISLGTMHS